MRYIIILFVLAMIWSCESQTQTNKKQIVTDTTYIDAKGKKYRFLGQIPETLRTKEQQDLLEKISDVTIRYTVVRNNHLVLTLTKAQYLATGIPERYYNLLIRSMKESNDFIDKGTIKNLDLIIKERNEQYRRYKKNRQDRILSDTGNKKT